MPLDEEYDEALKSHFADIPNIANDKFKNWIFKIDQNIGDKDKIFFRYGYNNRAEKVTVRAQDRVRAEIGRIEAHAGDAVDRVYGAGQGAVFPNRARPRGKRLPDRKS